MKNLLKLEFSRLKRQKSFYVCTLIAIAFLLLLESTAYLLNRKLPLEDIAHLSGVHSMLTGIYMSSYTLLVSIFVALYFCDDLVQNTIKNIMSKGYTRMQVFGAKCISCCVGATIMFVVVELAAALIGTGMYGFGKTLDGDFWGVIATQYVANMANVLLCIAICAKFRKVGTSIMGIIFLPDVVAMVLALADGIWKTSVSQYWFTAFLNETAMLHWTFNSVLRECLLGSAIYLPVFCALGLSFFKKREL